ncbi:MAG TPA: DNA (cytosine-5-)-methyltransferase [Candidatus Pelethenecus sp.]|nr:DNA (cytosine-5-)-methyltransferase [Candidatus Pelethenecus sp.]
MKLRVFEAFAGIGAQHAALKRLNIEYELVGVSEWFIDAIECYDAIHYNGIPPIELPSYEEQKAYLKQFTFSKNSVDPYNINKMSMEQIAKLYQANKRIKNFGSITEIDGLDLPEMDLLVYSFPCQDLSTGGKTLGMAKGSNTKSGLLWEIERILLQLKDLNKLPEFLLLENVKALLAHSNKRDFDQWKEFLESIGYKNDEPLVLDASDYGVPQDRKRVFMVSHLKTKLNITKNKLHKNRNYVLSDFVHSENGNPAYRQEYEAAKLNATPSRVEMMEINGKNWREDLIIHTITCNMDRSNTAVMFPYKDTFRLLTIREAFLLMGFTNEEYENAAKTQLSYRKMNKLIGNSIVVNVLVEIFRAMFEGRDDNDSKITN